MSDEELRLECLKLAFNTYFHRNGMHNNLSEFNRSVPANASKLANKYFDYLKNGVPLEPEDDPFGLL